MSEAKHPFLRGSFATYGEERKAARGLPSSRDFEKLARQCDERAGASMSKARYFDEPLEELKREAARLIGEQPSQRANIEAIADERRQGFERAKEERLEAAQHQQKCANEQRRYAEEARAFEARFDSNPYKDPLRDAVEKHNKQVLAEWEAKRRKAQERRAARG